MFEQRQLIKDIPSGKFHSVLMTAFSINLYYWEIQLLKELSSKGINYVSAVVDSDCLSDQLLNFSKAFGGEKPLEFSLHGYKANGAFHPKIQFYAGKDAVLVLVGSGNLTVSGHGKNLEVWTPVMVDSVNDSAYPFVRDVWAYLVSIYKTLGDEARNIIAAVKGNCSLLQGDVPISFAEHRLDDGSSIRLFVDGTKTLFQQCEDWIGEERLKSITILSPFYDRRAEMVKALYQRYRPDTMNIIVENGFGAPPKRKDIPEYVSIYNWDQAGAGIVGSNRFYHAKCFFFEGENNHYLICGSSNASVAAFGTTTIRSTNREASVGYKSQRTDYFKESGLCLVSPIGPNEIEESVEISEEKGNTHQTIWIREASYEYNKYKLKLTCSADIKGAKVVFCSGDRGRRQSFDFASSAGEGETKGAFGEIFNPLYVEIIDKNGNLISNRQFVISSISMVINDPSSDSVEYRRRCHDIESGDFVNNSVFRFFEYIINDTETKLLSKASAPKLVQAVPGKNSGNAFSSFEDYIKDDGTGITGDARSRKSESYMSRSTMLFDSIISYIGRSAKEKAEEVIDEEETEDTRKSIGKDVPKKSVRDKRPIDIKDKVGKMFDKYFEQLKPVAFLKLDATSSRTPKAPAVVEMEALKRFMAALFFLNRTLSYRFIPMEGSDEEQPLMELAYSNSFHKTATEYIFRVISLFSLSFINSKIEEETNDFIKSKVNGYRQYAFEMSVALISICDWLNEGNDDYGIVCNLKESTLRNIQKALRGDISGNTMAKVFDCYDRNIQELDGFEKSHVERLIEDNLKLLKNNTSSNVVWTDRLGYIVLLPIPASSGLTLPATMACTFNWKRSAHCPEFFYHQGRGVLLPIKPKKY